MARLDAVRVVRPSRVRAPGGGRRAPRARKCRQLFARDMPLPLRTVDDNANASATRPTRRGRCGTTRARSSRPSGVRRPAWPMPVAAHAPAPAARSRDRHGRRSPACQRWREGLVARGDLEQVSPGRGSVELRNRAVKRPPQVLRSAASRAQLRFVGRLACWRAVRRPLKARSLGLTTGGSLAGCACGQRCLPSAETGVGGRDALRLECRPPLLLRCAARGLAPLLLLSGHQAQITAHNQPSCS
jgi:hypothetical protein